MLYAVPVPVLLTIIVKLIVSPTAILTSFVGVFVTIRFGSFLTIGIVLVIELLDFSPLIFSARNSTSTLFNASPSFICILEYTIML